MFFGVCNVLVNLGCSSWGAVMFGILVDVGCCVSVLAVSFSGGIR